MFGCNFKFGKTHPINCVFVFRPLFPCFRVGGSFRSGVQPPTGSSKTGIRSTGTDRHRPAQTGTDRHRPAQTGTDRHRPAQTGTDRHRPAQTGTDRHGPTGMGRPVRERGGIIFRWGRLWQCRGCRGCWGLWAGLVGRVFGCGGTPTRVWFFRGGPGPACARC